MHQNILSNDRTPNCDKKRMQTAVGFHHSFKFICRTHLITTEPWLRPTAAFSLIRACHAYPALQTLHSLCWKYCKIHNTNQIFEIYFIQKISLDSSQQFFFIHFYLKIMLLPIDDVSSWKDPRRISLPKVFLKERYIHAHV